ncbi:winged helix-turn-helix transcriptional regulator [Salinirubellus salinus]|uniref:Winged helix-turn-helix transcriptional regulator n=1 Tax=Salinirubellus salinus TaxID=1364945 RepID=A0A9E7R5E9_9EURY|nr:winged helix-turn-helix transcriptional regulator [Salinirubellus salinus]UWM55678.1 winged helix-turn-helix transcriptional regulator [Salinirubellus salinus]
MDEREAWREFLRAEGTLHIVADLGTKPRRFTDLEESLRISTSTLSKRLEEGIRLEAWELDRVIDEEGDRKLYRLDKDGQQVFDAMERYGAVEASQEARRLLSHVDDIQELLVERYDD